MSKGAGAVERAIIDAFRDEDRIWTASELAALVYKTKHPSRSHKLAIKRAVRSAIRRIRAEDKKCHQLEAQAQASLGPRPENYEEVEEWYEQLYVYPAYVAAKAARRQLQPSIHMVKWRATLQADATLVFHHDSRPVRIWAVSIDPLGPTFHEAAIEEITKTRVSVRYGGVRCPLDRYNLSLWGCNWRGVLFVSARDGHIAAQLWQYWSQKYASDWDAWTKDRIAKGLPHLRLAEARALLGVPDDYDRDDVLRAFRRLAHIHHPDHGGNADKFRDLIDARDLLLQFVGEKGAPVKMPTRPEFIPTGTVIRYVAMPEARKLPNSKKRLRPS